MFEGYEMKIDLRKSKATVVDQETLDNDFVLDGEKNVFSFLSHINFKEIFNIIIRLIICCVGTVALMQYEQASLKKLAAQKNSANNEYSKLQNKMKSLQKKISGFAYLKDKSVEFTNKLSIMERVVQKRSKVIRGLDHIQGVIPKKVWLNRVNYSKNKLTLDGFSNTNKQVQTFIESMEKTNIFESVDLDRMFEQGALKQKRFTIQVTLR